MMGCFTIPIIIRNQAKMIDSLSKNTLESQFNTLKCDMIEMIESFNGKIDQNKISLMHHLPISDKCSQERHFDQSTAGVG
jgi:hypothetical protein